MANNYDYAPNSSEDEEDTLEQIKARQEAEAWAAALEGSKDDKKSWEDEFFAQDEEEPSVAEAIFGQKEEDPSETLEDASVEDVPDTDETLVSEGAAAEEEPETPVETVAEEEPEPAVEEDPSETSEEPEVPEEPQAEEEPKAVEEPVLEVEPEAIEETPEEPATEDEPETPVETVAEEEPEPAVEEDPSEISEEPPSEDEPETPGEPVAEDEPEAVEAIAEEEEPETTLEEEPTATDTADDEWESIQQAYGEESIADEDRNVELPADLNESAQPTVEEEPEAPEEPVAEEEPATPEDEWEAVQEAYAAEAIKDEDRNVELPEDLRTQEEPAELAAHESDQEAQQQDARAEQAASNERGGNALAAPVAALLLANYLSKRRDKNIERNLDRLSKDLKDSQHDARSYQSRAIRNEAQTTQESRSLSREEARFARGAEANLDQNIAAGPEKVSEIIADSPYAEQARRANRPLTREEYERIKAEQPDQNMPDYREYLRGLGLSSQEVQAELDRAPNGQTRAEAATTRINRVENQAGPGGAGGSSAPVAGSASHHPQHLQPHIANSELFSGTPPATAEQAARKKQKEFYKQSLTAGAAIGAGLALLGVIVYFLFG